MVICGSYIRFWPSLHICTFMKLAISLVQLINKVSLPKRNTYDVQEFAFPPLLHCLFLPFTTIWTTCWWWNVQAVRFFIPTLAAKKQIDCVYTSFWLCVPLGESMCRSLKLLKPTSICSPQSCTMWCHSFQYYICDILWTMSFAAASALQASFLAHTAS